MQGKQQGVVFTLCDWTLFILIVLKSKQLLDKDLAQANSGEKHLSSPASSWFIM